MPEQENVPSKCKFATDSLTVHLDEIIPSDVRCIESTVDDIIDLIHERGCKEDLDRIDLALREALANAIIHGNGSDPEKFVRVCVALREDCDVLIIVKDSGTGFDPAQVPSPFEAENLLSGHGRGIFLINQLMDEVRFAFDSGTTVMMQRRPAPKL